MKEEGTSYEAMKTGDITLATSDKDREHPEEQYIVILGGDRTMQILCLGRDVRIVEGVEHGIGCLKCGVDR